MRPSPTPQRPERRHRRLLVACLVVPLLLTGACSGDDGDGADSGGKDAGAAGGSPSAATTEQAADTVTTLIGTGLAQIESEEYAQARSTFQTVLDLDPENDYAWYNLGYVAQLQGDEATAVQRYTTALTHNKDFSPAIYNLAILTESSDLEAAVELYRREIAVKPDDAAAHMRLGFALRHLGQDAEAEQLLQQGIELDPSMAGVQAPTYR